MTNTTKDTSMPTNRMRTLPPVRALPSRKYFTSFKKLAPNMVGMARKKENSAATGREQHNRIGPEDRRTRTGGAGNQGEKLKGADEQRRFVAETRKAGDRRFALAVAVLDDNKSNAVHNEGDSNHQGAVKILVEQLVKQKTDHRRWDTGDDQPSPTGRGSAFFEGWFCAGKRD